MSDGTKNTRAVSGLPEAPMMANFSWSPDQKKMAFTQTTDAGVEVWVLDIPMATVRKLTDARVNANMGDVINWFEDSEAILVKMISADRKKLIDTKKAVPTGPTISVADGKKAQNRTYQDLLQNPNDEHNFEQLALSEIHKVYLDGSSESWLGSDMYSGISFSRTGTM
jgi:dipeptidyl aminopeptidase/acylaminoacyl peptidase